MNDIYQSARKPHCPPPSLMAVNEYCQKATILANHVSEAIAARQDVEELIGRGNAAMMRDNHDNHTRFMCSLLQHYNLNVLRGTVNWVVRAYLSHGFSPGYWAVQHAAWVDALDLVLSPTSRCEIAPVYELLFGEAQRAIAAIQSEASVAPD